MGRFDVSGSGPSAFSDKECLLDHVGPASVVLLGRVCLGNVTNVVSKYRGRKGMLSSLVLGQ